MKKVVSLLAVCVLLVGMMACATFSVSAASPKEDIVTAVKDVLPDKYDDRYVPLVENVLKQIEVTQAQADEVVGYVKACAAAINTDKGPSLHSYTQAERKLVIDYFGKCCTALGLTYKFVDSEHPDHTKDVAVYVYKADGTLVAVMDGDGVKKTDIAETNYALIFALVSALALAVGGAVYGKKLMSR